MTPGLAMAAAGFVVALAIAYKRQSVFALHFALGVVAMRIFLAYMPDPFLFLSYAAVWVAIGGAAIRRGEVLPGALALASGLCYGAAEAVSAQPAIWVPAMTAADVCGIAALVAAGVSDGGIRGRSDVGGSHRRFDFLGRAGGCDLATKKAGR
jgi:hypothetical protein